MMKLKIKKIMIIVHHVYMMRNTVSSTDLDLLNLKPLVKKDVGDTYSMNSCD